jgi:hypothetical protein
VLRLKMLGLCGSLMLACSGLMAQPGVGPAPAAGSGKAATSDTSKPKERAHKTRVVVKPGSGETPAERGARLKRECKGLPNAGACTGYAQ